MQTFLRLNCLGLIFLWPIGAVAQSTPATLAPANEKISYSPHKVKAHKTKAPKTHKIKVTHTARYEFYKRVEKAARQKQKLLRKLAKPQFANRAYFGHKRMPKKRIWFKMRYCDECGIRH
jgi:hypothetical protein